MGLVMGLDGFNGLLDGIVRGSLELRAGAMDGCGKGREKGRKRARRQ